MPGSGDMEVFTKAEYEAKYPLRYFLGSDDSCHTYLVPVQWREHWREWEELQSKDPDTLSDEDRERAWTVPEYAKRIDGWHTITFTDPQES
jgi:hypothetical protein